MDEIDDILDKTYMVTLPNGRIMSIREEDFPKYYEIKSAIENGTPTQFSKEVLEEMKSLMYDLGHKMR